MLNTNDHRSMRKDVAHIINDWKDLVDILIPLPKEQQPGWNELMDEIVGDIKYTIISDQGVERRDVPNSELETNVGGDKFNGESILSIPDTIHIDESCLFILDNDEIQPWRVKSIKYNTGETVVRIVKLVGGINGT